MLLAGLSWLLAPTGYYGTFGDFIGAGELAVIAYLTSRFAADRWAFGLIVRVVAVTSLLVVGAAILGLALFYANVETVLVSGYGALVTSADYARVQAGSSTRRLRQLLHLRLRGDRPGRGRASPKAEAGRPGRAGLHRRLDVLARHHRLHPRRADPDRRHAAKARGRGSGSAWRASPRWRCSRFADTPSGPFSLRVSTAHAPGRSQELTSSIETSADHPLLGTGPGSLPGEAQPIGPRQAHNTPVGVAATLGIPALLVLIAFLAVIWRDRSRPTNRATWGGLAGLGVDGLGQDTEHFRHVWVLIGLAWAQSRSTTRRLET